MRQALITVALVAVFLAWGCEPSAPTTPSRPAVAPESEIASDERIVFFDTDARRSADGKGWVLPIHGWLHEHEDSKLRKGAIAAVLKETWGLGPTDATRDNFDRRVELFLVDNESGKRVTVRIAGKSVTVGPSEANGHFHGEIPLTTNEVAKVARDGSVEFTAVLPGDDRRTFSGRVHLVDSEGLSVISDIDDTVKVTGVTNRKTMIDRTFLRDFEAAPGMAALYRSWAAQGVRIHFVSSSPWHLYEPLDEFLTRDGFPPRSMSLKLVRLKDETFWDLFKHGDETKPKQIEPILAAYPQRRFVLVGDSGEQDPEVYAALVKKHPERIERVYIRNVTGESAEDERFQTLFTGIDRAKWRLFTDAASLDLPR